MQQSFGLFSLLGMVVVGMGLAQAPHAALCRSDLSDPNYVGGVDAEGSPVVPADVAPVPEVRLGDGRLLAEVPLGRSGHERVWVPIETDAQAQPSGAGKPCRAPRK